MGGVGIAGGGLGTLALALVGYFVFGIDPFVTQQVVTQFDGRGAQQEGKAGTPEDQAGQFVDIVSANVNDVWTSKLKGYQAPKVVLYEQGTQTGCGLGQSAMGPFYCPTDRSIYLDLSFWREMETRLGASGADFARAYVIAHEFGHHVQTLTGTSRKVQQAQQGARNQAEASRYSVALSSRPIVMPARGPPMPQPFPMDALRWIPAIWKEACARSMPLAMMHFSGRPAEKSRRSV